jgi:hypothetical protein
VIQPSASPCGSPIIIVPRNDGTWRMCINYKALNKITLKNMYPLPRINDHWTSCSIPMEVIWGT